MSKRAQKRNYVFYLQFRQDAKPLYHFHENLHLICFGK